MHKYRVQDSGKGSPSESSPARNNSGRQPSSGAKREKIFLDERNTTSPYQRNDDAAGYPRRDGSTATYVRMEHSSPGDIPGILASPSGAPMSPDAAPMRLSVHDKYMRDTPAKKLFGAEKAVVQNAFHAKVLLCPVCTFLRPLTFVFRSM